MHQHFHSLLTISQDIHRNKPYYRSYLRRYSLVGVVRFSGSELSFSSKKSSTKLPIIQAAYRLVRFPRFFQCSLDNDLPLITSLLLQAQLHKHPISHFLPLLASRSNSTLHQDLVVIARLLNDLPLLGH
ncbi:hypothetical protein K443DRAFT_352328 [Laccaria amethystina LaAM-08-1]|uniref:Uncharacterized protein n=1 Tax=Laccaria amethystina LaAM-08-1 TaxID=1095629 RepID=A0A0C9XK27_9AGAR|nr:hypothetical protein K443DRAFT_352328 [Laccaria amethystina LaAM-08-1]